MYKKILPAFHNLLKLHGINEILSPNTFHINQNESSIIFEDLIEKNYKMANRTNGLDLAHAKMIIKKLAKMHLISLIYNQENNHELEKFFNRGMFCRQANGINSYFETNFDYLIKEIERWNPGWEYYVKKLNKMKKNLIENARKVFDPCDTDFNVLVHGDLWINNIMYKYNDNNIPEDVIMVDFQMCKWGSPAIDLLYFMATSLSDEFRANNQDELIQYYHKCLIGISRKFNYTGFIPNLHQLQQQFFKNYFYSFTSTVIVMPMMMSEHAVGADFRTLMGLDDRSDAMKNGIYSSLKCHEILKRVLPIFDKKGILDL